MDAVYKNAAAERLVTGFADLIYAHTSFFRYQCFRQRFLSGRQNKIAVSLSVDQQFRQEIAYHRPIVHEAVVRLAEEGSPDARRAH